MVLIPTYAELFKSISDICFIKNCMFNRSSIFTNEREQDCLSIRSSILGCSSLLCGEERSSIKRFYENICLQQYLSGLLGILKMEEHQNDLYYSLSVLLVLLMNPRLPGILQQIVNFHIQLLAIIKWMHSIEAKT